MLLADLIAGAIGFIFAAIGAVVLLLADTGPFGTPSPEAVMFAAVCFIIALGAISLPVLRPKHI